ncbi:hypothetical protein Misp01_19730 [Microtetraspora sp. NBRC 13810]|uniref:MarR family winged helix-turn-helix transcriptional regulator n=1 Tax=Microtetraspora sp. NBRC 13810 TaxID=3030990 RepID=UPI0024A5B637|nr:MarR family winged helix-turn-helix transcriptional regulator [Microtetraspora sp. NBRC 13810]GLW06843.1 hypothetical protein Misp01_19730 [Microtetraspora sp. NBRC 13810]
MATTADSRTPARLRSTPSWLLTHVATHANRLVGEAFHASYPRRYHFSLLAALEEFGPASQAELGRRCEIDRSYIVETVNDLADRDFVVRAPDPADRRRNTITITEAGVRELHRIAQQLDVIQDALLAPLTTEERGQLTALLGRLLDHHAHQREEGPSWP